MKKVGSEEAFIKPQGSAAVLCKLPSPERRGSILRTRFCCPVFGAVAHTEHSAACTCSADIR